MIANFIKVVLPVGRSGEMKSFASAVLSARAEHLHSLSTIQAFSSIYLPSSRLHWLDAGFESVGVLQ
jgi:hypothetical protein